MRGFIYKNDELSLELILPCICKKHYRNILVCCIIDVLPNKQVIIMILYFRTIWKYVGRYHLKIDLGSFVISVLFTYSNENTMRILVYDTYTGKAPTTTKLVVNYGYWILIIKRGMMLCGCLIFWRRHLLSWG